MESPSFNAISQLETRSGDPYFALHVNMYALRLNKRRKGVSP